MQAEKAGSRKSRMIGNFTFTGFLMKKTCKSGISLRQQQGRAGRRQSRPCLTFFLIHAVCKFFNKKSVQIVEADSHISD